MGVFGSKRPVMCQHNDMAIEDVHGPQDEAPYAHDYSSFAIRFAHVTCADCNMNCYRYNPDGPYGCWKPWVPACEEETQKGSRWDEYASVPRSTPCGDDAHLQKPNDAALADNKDDWCGNQSIMEDEYESEDSVK